VILLLAACFADVLLSGSSFFVRDLTRYYFPTKSVIHRIVASGELPLWNRFYAGGQPALANPEYEVFYPGQWLIHLPDFYLGFRLHILLHFLIGTIGMYALMRSLRARAEAALITAISFALSGPFVSASNLLTTLFPLAWFPWCLLFFRRYLLQRTRRDLALAAMCMAMVLLIFEPGNVLQIAGICAGYAWYHAVRSQERWRAIGASTVPLALAAGIAAVQLLPTIDFIRHTARSLGMSYEMIATWSLPPIRLAEFLQPHFLGRNPFLSNDYWGGFLYRGQGAPYFQSLYLGLLPLIALISGVVRRDRKTVAGVLSAALLLIVCMGDHTPLLRLAYEAKVPLALRFPERFATGAAFILVLASGLAINRVLNDRAWLATSFKVAMVVLFMTVIMTGFAFTGIGETTFARLWQVSPNALARSMSMCRADWLSVLWRAVVLAGVLATLRRRLVPAFAVLFVVLDLVPLVNELAPRMPREFFSPPPIVDELRDAGPASRIFFQPEWSAGPVMRWYNADRSRIYWVIRNGLFPRLPAAWGRSTILERDIDLTNLRPAADFLKAFLRHPPRDPIQLDAWAAMANVEWLAAFRPPLPRPRDPSAVRPITFLRLRESPRYYFADEVVPFRSEEDFVEAVSSHQHGRHAAYVAAGSLSASRGSVLAFEERANHAEVDTVTSGRGLLVASVTRDDGWRATIDGRPATILPVNIAFQGVAVPPGHHRIAFTYHNPFFDAGVVISAITLLLALFLFSARHAGSALTYSETGWIRGCEKEQLTSPRDML
jgi:hypothetical protein